MNNIPTKAEVAQVQADKASGNKKRLKRARFETFRIEMIRGMVVGNESYYQVMGYVSRKMQARLRKAFAPEWTLEFENVGTGCTIRWS